MPKRKGFTLVELLVVIGILCLLISVVVGIFARNKSSVGNSHKHHLPPSTHAVETIAVEDEAGNTVSPGIKVITSSQLEQWDRYAGKDPEDDAQRVRELVAEVRRLRSR